MLTININTMQPSNEKGEKKTNKHDWPVSVLWSKKFQNCNSLKITLRFSIFGKKWLFLV